jgi:hypothetical protein
MYKEFKDIESGTRYVFTIDDFAALQNYYIKKVIRHTHTNIPANYVKIADSTDTENPVGLNIPLDGDVLTFQDHVGADHSLNIPSGRLLARGWTVPTKVRCLITTPIYDTTSNLPFPTYNMSPFSIDKDLNGENDRSVIPSNRHNPAAYSNYRHYLWIMPMNAVSYIHPSHKAIIDNQSSAIFAKTPLFIHSSNTDFLKKINSATNTPNFRALSYIPDYAEEKIWSLTEDFTCWLSGYRSVVANNDIALMFNDYYNEFVQILSTVNYEELNREYYFRLEKAAGNLMRLDCNYVSDITRLMEAKALDTMDISAGGGLARDSIEKRISPYYTKDYYYNIDKKTQRLKSSLLDSCMEKDGNKITFFTNGLANFATINDTIIDSEITIPKYFDNGYRQCLIINGEYGTSRRSFKKLHRGRVMLVYQMVDGFVSTPYEIYSSDSVLSSRSTASSLPGSTTQRNYIDVQLMGDTGIE